jgi:hypothetical protein
MPRWAARPCRPGSSFEQTKFLARPAAVSSEPWRAANTVRLQLHSLAYNLGNFFRTLATLEPIKEWLLTRLKEKLIKTGAKVVRHGSNVAFQMAEVRRPSANRGTAARPRSHQRCNEFDLSIKTRETCVLMTEEASHGRPTENLLAAKRIYKLQGATTIF